MILLREFDRVDDVYTRPINRGKGCKVEPSVEGWGDAVPFGFLGSLYLSLSLSRVRGRLVIAVMIYNHMGNVAQKKHMYTTLRIHTEKVRHAQSYICIYMVYICVYMYGGERERERSRRGAARAIAPQPHLASSVLPSRMGQMALALTRSCALGGAEEPRAMQNLSRYWSMITW